MSHHHQEHHHQSIEGAGPRGRHHFENFCSNSTYCQVLLRYFSIRPKIPSTHTANRQKFSDFILYSASEEELILPSPILGPPPPIKTIIRLMMRIRDGRTTMKVTLGTLMPSIVLDQRQWSPGSKRSLWHLVSSLLVGLVLFFQKQP